VATTPESIVVDSWNDMRQFGVNSLTGEACAYSMRLLCDLSGDGAALVADYFGLKNTSVFQPNWNSMVGEHAAIASVMLVREELIPLATFALFRMGVLAVVERGRRCDLIGVFDADWLKRYEDLIASAPDCGYAIRRNPRPSGGSRNQHAFSGRTV
jgi:hypothetical protein